MSHIPFWVALLAIAIVSALIALPVGYVPDTWLSPIDRLPIRLLVALLVFALTANLLFALYSYLRLTRTQRMIRSAFGLVTTLGPFLCVAPYGMRQIENAQIEASGMIAGMDQDTAKSNKPGALSAKGHLKGSMKTGGLDPILGSAIIFALLVISISLCVFADFYSETEQPGRVGESR